MVKPVEKKSRRHSLARGGRAADPKGERFFLQGQRWRLPKGLGLAEVEARIVRLRALWTDQEKLCQDSVFINLSAATLREDYSLEDAVAAVRRGQLTDFQPDTCRFNPDGPVQTTDQSTQFRDFAPSKSWLQSTIESKGVVRGPLEPNWSPLALWIADQIKQGVQPVRLPPLDELFATVIRGNRIEYHFRCLASILSQPVEAQPTRIEQLMPWDALTLLQCLMRVFPSIPWAMYDHQIKSVVESHTYDARQLLNAVTAIKPDDSSVEEMLPARPGIRGSFHEAVRTYAKKRRADFTKGGVFDGSGHHMLGLVENFESRQKDVPLARLGFAECQEIYDFWRNRPLNTRTRLPLSAKHSSSHIGELDRFFKWLHTTPEFGWRRPVDFDLIERKVKRLDSDRRSIHDIELKTFSVEQLRLLYKHTLPSERLRLVWCLNCSHGAAEIGRVEWGDLYLKQPHPWIKEGLKFDSPDDDSWCGLLRPKTDVIGWWLLWPETVRLVEWWRNELQKSLKKQLLTSDRMLVSKTGEPLYRDSSRNAQTSFANQWSRLLIRVAKHEGDDAIPKLPFGTLRDQMSNWLGSDENQAVLASTALAHGIPHSKDKLLYKHYSNRPWARLFDAQKKYRDILQPMFDAVPDPVQEPYRGQSPVEMK